MENAIWPYSLDQAQMGSLKAVAPAPAPHDPAHLLLTTQEYVIPDELIPKDLVHLTSPMLLKDRPCLIKRHGKDKEPDHAPNDG